MKTVYRVIPYLPASKKGALGHPLFFPKNRNVHRVDNPGHYKVAYFAADAQCAFAEKFGYQKQWNDLTLRPDKSLLKSKWALVSYEINNISPIFDMDNASNLLKLQIKPSRVVTRDRAITQAWALRVFEVKKNSGVSWWSFHSSDWVTLGIWELDNLKVKKIELLSLEHPAVQPAAEVIKKLVMH